jgi:predicted secreted protein
MNTAARHDLPRDEHELAKLAYLLGCESAQALLDGCREYTRENRRRFLREFGDV